jgi:Fur family ferric uptake transcriptional regulator
VKFTFIRPDHARCELGLASGLRRSEEAWATFGIENDFQLRYVAGMESKNGRPHSARVRAILRREGAPGAHLRASAQRARVVEALLAAGKHFTVEEVQAIVAAQGPRIGYSTVYRTLRLLAEHGAVTERHFGNDVTRYELSEGAAKHHDHLICVRCGVIVEFEEPQIEALQDEVARRHGYELRSHVHELYGRCPRCAREPR